MKSKKVIGIDLGTTNSCVAVVVGGYPQVIPNAQGYKITPSVIAFMDEGKTLVGQHAKRQALINPERTVFSAKRLIGRKWNSPESKRARAVCPYPLEEGSDSSILILQGGTKLSIPQVSAKVLDEMKQVAATFLAEEVTDAVITVPAYFNDGQRQATKMAGEIAGLNVIRIINEPTAAALAYGNAQKRNVKIAVYDLGGGTFDISILEIKDGVFKVLATGGDTFLGGDDIDDRLIDFIAEKFLKETGIDVRKERTSLQRLKDAAEQLKCELSILKEARISLPFIAVDKEGPRHLEVTVTRENLDQLCQELIQRTLKMCEAVLKESQLDKGDLDDVLLVGGQTRMPKIHDTVSNFFGRSASKQIHPDEAVAVGAAIHGESLSSNNSETLLLDVTPMALGIRTAGDTITQLIKRNTTVPVSKAHTFTTVTDNQTTVKIQVYQGDSPVASENELMGEFQLVGIRNARAGEAAVEVEFSIDANGIVHVSAKDLDTGKEQSITLTTGPDSDQPEKSSEAENFAVKLADQSELDQLKQEMRVVLHKLRKQYEQKGRNLNPELQRRIVSALDNGPGFIKTDDGAGLTRLKAEVKRIQQEFK